MKRLLKTREVGITVILLVIVIIVTIQSPYFLTASNIVNVLNNTVVLGIMALGMTVVIITGGIDVSVGSMLAAIAVIIGNFLFTPLANGFTIILVALTSGLLLGAFNGFFVAKFKIPAIIVTLGTLSVYRGVNLEITRGTWISGLPDWFLQFNRGMFLGLPFPIYIFIAAILMTYAILKYTQIGRWVYAYGGDAEAAERIGIRPAKVHLFVYSYMGLMTGLAALVHSAQLGNIQPTAAVGIELMVIAAVVIGGTNIFGGLGSVAGTVLGVLLLAFLQNGLVLARISSFWQDVFIGLIIVAAVTFDFIREKRRERENKALYV